LHFAIFLVQKNGGSPLHLFQAYLPSAVMMNRDSPDRDEKA